MGVIENSGVFCMEALMYRCHPSSVILKFENGSIAVVSTADDIGKFYQFDMIGTEGSLKVVTNPWMPEINNNKIIICRNDEDTPREINVTAEKI